MSTFDTYESSDGRDGAFSYSAARLLPLGVVQTWLTLDLQPNDRSGISRTYR